MPTPEMPQKAPYPVEVEAGKSYWWCACGKSASQPFCDGSHKGSEFAPIKFQADGEQDGLFLRLQTEQEWRAVRCDAPRALS